MGPEEAGMHKAPTVYVVSGGIGASGEQLAHTVLAQFSGVDVPVKRLGKVRQPEQLDQVVEDALSTGGIILHTLVDQELRAQLIEKASRRGVLQFDAMGPLIDGLSRVLQQEPINQPGMYRQLHQAYFERIEAIEYSKAHDDGQKPQEWKEAEVVLVGVSRTGKTPLSLYLSVLGWKAANVPVVMALPLAKELFELDPERVVGLTIEPGQLIVIRQQRQQRLGTSGPSEYVDPEKVFEEVEYARKLFRKSGFRIVDVTDKPIETSAEEIMRLVSRQSPSS